MGEVPPALKDLVAAANDLVPLYSERQAFGELPSEDEMVTHFAVPFLRALGWPSERIAVKWRYIDVAVFRALPRVPENCHFVVEAKRLGAGKELRGSSLRPPRRPVCVPGVRGQKSGVRNSCLLSSEFWPLIRGAHPLGFAKERPAWWGAWRRRRLEVWASRHARKARNATQDLRGARCDRCEKKPRVAIVARGEGETGPERAIHFWKRSVRPATWS